MAVTLQAVDGGANYYSAHGFTQAVNAGWDNGVIPVGIWLAPMASQTDANRWLDLNLNTAYAFTGNSNMSLFTANHISAIVNSQELSQILANNGGALGASTVGLLSYDEPPDFASGVTGPLSTTPNSVQDHHFWWMNMTWNWLYYQGSSPISSSADVLDAQVATPNGTLRHIDLQSTDIYWFAGAHAVPNELGQGGLIFGLGRNMTQDEAARGSNYGAMIDIERGFQAGHFPAPITAFIENGGPYTEDTTTAGYIKPAELNWAVWSSLIHGAQNIVYFNHSFAGPGGSQDNLRDPYYSTVQPGQTISIYDQTKATDALVEQMGPVLHAPNALDYVSTPGGYQFGTATSYGLSGIETAAHLYNGSYYIFADTRDSETQTNIGATFTLNDPLATSVTVVNEGRSIAVTGGQFSDTFATGATVHIYQVNDSGPPPPPPPPPPDNTIIGTNRADTLVSTAGNDAITTGGGRDLVVFSGASFGHDTITDFHTGSTKNHDTIQFSTGTLANFAAVQAHAAQVGNDTVITVDTANSVTLTGVTLTNLHSYDFKFV